jgi:hypothetical protein
MMHMISLINHAITKKDKPLYWLVKILYDSLDCLVEGFTTKSNNAIRIVNTTAAMIGVIKFNAPPPSKLFNTKLTISNNRTAQNNTARYFIRKRYLYSIYQQNIFICIVQRFSLIYNKIGISPTY